MNAPLFDDPIVDEVRRIRDAHAARFNYDIEAIVRDIQEKEKAAGLVFVNGVAHLPAKVPQSGSVSVDSEGFNETTRTTVSE